MNKRLALLQVVFSVIALAAVVWWASHQEAPTFPHDGKALASMGIAALLYAVATVVRAERWHQILAITGVKANRSDCYALTTVGYMGNNVLPARAGEVLRVVLLDQRTKAGKRAVLGTIVAERALDLVVLAAMFLIVGYGVLKDNALPASTFSHPFVILGVVVVLALGAGVAYYVVHQKGLKDRIRNAVRPLVGALRALWGRPGLPLLAGTILLWGIEGSVYYFVAHAAGLNFSVTGALYLVGLANFVAALPAAPGSIGTFDAAVAFGSRVLGGAGGLVLSYVILVRFVLYVPITIVGLVMLVVRYGGWARLRDVMRVQQTSNA